MNWLKEDQKNKPILIKIRDFFLYSKCFKRFQKCDICKKRGELIITEYGPKKYKIIKRICIYCFGADIK